MKKTLLTIIALLMGTYGVFAQLNPQTAEKAGKYRDVSKYVTMTKASSYVIRYMDGIYYLMGETDNQFEKNYASIKLGETKESAILTLTDLKELKKRIGNEVLVVDGYMAQTTLVNRGMSGVVFKTNGVAGESYCLYGMKLKKVTQDIQAFNE